MAARLGSVAPSAGTSGCDLRAAAHLRPRSVQPGRRPDPEAGMVTAETAAAVPALLLLLALSLGLVTVAVDGVRCVDAARVGARAAARGDAGEQAARTVAPVGATVGVTGAGGRVVVDVRAPARPMTAWLPAAVRPHARAVADVEQAPGAAP